jgi:hypothetical protein
LINKQQSEFDSEFPMDNKINFQFDDNSKIRVLDATKLTKGEDLSKECQNFNSKLNTFIDKSDGIIEIIESHAQRVEKQRLRVMK